MAILDLAGKAIRAGRSGACSGRARPRRSPATPPWSPGTADEVAADARALGRATASTTFKLKLGDAATTSRRCAPCARRSGPRRGSASTPTASWSVDEALGVLRLIEPLGRRARRAAGGRPAARWPRSRAASSMLIAADETVSSVPRTPRARGVGRALRPGDREARQGRRDRGGERDRRGAADLPVERPRRPARDRRGRPRGAGARVRPGRPPGSPTGWRPSACSRATAATAECALAGAELSVPDGPGLGVELDERALESLPDLAFALPMDPTNRNTALASAMVEELARCGVRRRAVSARARARRRWRSRFGASRRSSVSVIVDERSRRASSRSGPRRRPGPRSAILCTSGTAAANLHPAVCEADESAVPLIVLTADRPPELRGIGAGQTIDQLKLYGVRGPLVLRGRHARCRRRRPAAFPLGRLPRLLDRRR